MLKLLLGLSAFFALSVDNFIPKIWSARILSALRHAIVYGQDRVANRNYEGEISQAGDTVHINSVGDPTIFEYTKNQAMPAPEVLTDDQRSLVITESPAFNFMVDDVDARQAQGNIMNEAMESAAFLLRNEVDEFVGGLHTDVAADNLIGSDAEPESVTQPGEAYEALVELAVILDEADVPDNARWVAVTPWFHGLLLQDDRFVGTGGSGAEATLRNGQVGEAAGFAVLKTNNAPTGTDGGSPETINHKIIAGYPGAASMAEQINSTEAYRPEDFFSDAVKGLLLFGAKLVRPTGWAVLSAARE